MTRSIVEVDVTALDEGAFMEEGTQLCAKLKLIELMRHGEHRYARITKRGHLVMMTMVMMSLASADPKNVMKVS
jgi:hypothetical protein